MVTEVPGSYAPLPLVFPPIAGLLAKLTENCDGGIAVKFAANVLLLLNVKFYSALVETIVDPSFQLVKI